MNDQRAIHETVLRDMIDLVKGIKDSDTITAVMGRGQSVKSIAAASAGLTMVFPVMCSDSIEIDNASMVSKAIERKAATMLDLLLVANQTTEHQDVRDYVKQFHTNLKVGDDITVDGMIDLLDSIALGEGVEDISPRMTRTDENNLLSNDMRNADATLDDNVNDRAIGYYEILPGTEADPVIVSSPVEESSSPALKDLQRAKAESDFRIKDNLQDNDVRKANELIPTKLQVNYTFIGPDGGTPISTSALIGVKAKLYKIGSMDIMERLVDKSKNRNSFNKFIRATTRELSFFKDFLFAIDQAKVDALSSSNRGSTSKMWKILERRSTKSKFRRRLGMVNDAVAISTLVVSQEEVELIKKEYNIDLEDESVMRPILEEYNLMSFVIVDDVNEVVKFIFDTGDDLYEHLSFKSLERESQNQDYRRVVNLLSRVAN